MPGVATLKFKNQEEGACPEKKKRVEGHYHILARTIMKSEFLLEEGEKVYLLKLM